MYYRALSMQKMAGLPAAAAGKAVQRGGGGAHEGDGRTSGDGKSFSLEDLESMDKSVQKVFIKSPDYSVLESTGEARWAGGWGVNEQVWGGWVRGVQEVFECGCRAVYRSSSTQGVVQLTGGRWRSFDPPIRLTPISEGRPFIHRPTF